MKRIFCLILSLLMICGIFCGCSQKKPDDDNQSSDDEQKEDEITFDPGEPDYSFETVDASEELYGSDYREKYLNHLTIFHGGTAPAAVTICPWGMQKTAVIL